MSIGDVKKYAELCAGDEEIRKKAKGIGLSDIDGHIAHAKSFGLTISREDFEALAKEAGVDGKDELSEEDLKKVAGGFFTSTAGAVAVLAATSAAVAGGGVADLINKPGW
jgi:predicted ribosomally synthesized peptide with nif11-like leader